MICVLYRARGDLDRDEFMFFMTGGVGLENKLDNPDPSWLSDKSWDEICRLNDLKSMKGFRYETNIMEKISLCNILLCPVLLDCPLKCISNGFVFVSIAVYVKTRQPVRQN